MSSYSDDEMEVREVPHRFAKKSTNTVHYQRVHQTRRSSAIANLRLIQGSDKFLENFNPETSFREKRKLNRKIHPPSNVRRPPGALYDENGLHLSSYLDVCDCLNEECPGCFFPCPKCSSQKCGIECRVHRKYLYDQVEYHGYDIVIRNPLILLNPDCPPPLSSILSKWSFKSNLLLLAVNLKTIYPVAAERHREAVEKQNPLSSSN